MAMKSEHITGFAIGLGAAAVGYYMYSKNKTQVDQFLKQHGIDMPSSPVVDTANLSLEQLILEKEHLEDIIAEREMAKPESKEAEKSTPRKAPARKRSTKKRTAKASSAKKTTKST